MVEIYQINKKMSIETNLDNIINKLSSKVKGAFTNDQSVLSQFLRPSTLKEAYKYPARQDPIVGKGIKLFEASQQKIQSLPGLKQVSKFLAPDPNRTPTQKSIDDALNYGPQAIRSIEQKVVSKVAPKLSKTAKSIAKNIGEELDNLITKFARNPTEAIELEEAKGFLKDPKLFKKAQEVVDLYSKREVPGLFTGSKGGERTTYHGTSAENANKIKAGGFEIKSPSMPEKGRVLEGVFLAKDKLEAGNYGDVLETKISENLKLYKGPLGSVTQEIFEKTGNRELANNPKAMTDYLKKQGYDGWENAEEIAIFDPKKVSLSKPPLLEEAGKKTYYHGSNKSFDDFDFSLTGKSSGEKPLHGLKGSWFVDNKTVAEGYGKKVKGVKLDTSNFLTVDAKGKRLNDFRDELWEAKKNVRDKGKRGLIVKNLIDNADYSKSDIGDHVFVVDKSAIK